MYNMLRIIDISNVGNYISVTVEGNADKIHNNYKLIDEYGNMHTVISVGLEKYNDPHDISKYTTFLTEPCSLKVGTKLDFI